MYDRAQRLGRESATCEVELELLYEGEATVEDEVAGMSRDTTDGRKDSTPTQFQEMPAEKCNSSLDFMHLVSPQVCNIPGRRIVR